ncbi:MAG TPA: YicC/YloC family endoribonuclease [Thermoanaerobaculia bacterium]|nr:YicC/YloC family endoribonuclease [Thermoanaerobaculia bacterium]
MSSAMGGRVSGDGAVVSMTGFGAASGASARYRVTVEIRTVNHRGLDLVLRLKEACRSAEPDLRAMLKARLHRGRVEVAVNVDPVTEAQLDVDLDRPLAAALARLAEELRGEGLTEGGLRSGDLLRVPGLVRTSPRGPGWDGDDDALLREVAARALEQTLASRRAEGASLEDELRRGFERLRELTSTLAGRRGEVTQQYLRQLEERLRSLVGGALPDQQRLEQEVALLVEKSDVNEELERLRAHIDQGTVILQGAPPTGRRLDILLQEILRELSTVAAKCRDLEMIRTVMDARLQSEQMREQVQNVE